MRNAKITLAIHSSAKAVILKQTLEKRGINVSLEKIDNPNLKSISHDSYNVKISIKDLSRALTIIEEKNLFSYKEPETLSHDDGRARILVAVDFSDYSMKACQAAFQVAGRINAKVKILHVFHNVYFPSHIPFADSLKETPDEGLLNKVRKQMLDLCCEIDRKISVGEWDSVNYSYSIREGQVYEEIENFILEYKPMLLVVGTKGKDHTKTALLGNVTADVIEAVNIPVLAIPESLDITHMKVSHIAFLSNLQTSAIESFDKFVEITRPYPDVKITLLHINRINPKGDKWENPELEAISGNFKKRYPQFNVSYQLIDSPNILKGVADFLEKEDVAIICVTTPKRTLWARMFFPSFPRKMLNFAEKAILVLRA